jgi:hypothetical protein
MFKGRGWGRATQKRNDSVPSGAGSVSKMIAVTETFGYDQIIHIGRISCKNL